MSLIRIRRERKEAGAKERTGIRTRTLLLLLGAVIFVFWYLSANI